MGSTNEEIEFVLGNKRNEVISPSTKSDDMLIKNRTSSKKMPKKRRLSFVPFVVLIVLVVSTALLSFRSSSSQLRNSLFVKDDRVKTPAPTVAPTKTLFETQIENFRNNGSGLILNIHITHHAGTTLCSVLGKNLGAPGKFCNWPAETDANVPENYPIHHPWTFNETAKNVVLARQAYRFIAWEPTRIPSMSFKETNWEDPNLVSILVVREPISRALAGDAHTAHRHPFVRTKSHMDPKKNYTDATDTDTDTGTLRQWWKFAKDPFYDNFALRRLIGPPIDPNDPESNKVMTRKHLEFAKDLVSRFTFVLDQACLNENLYALKEVLNITTPIIRRPSPNVKSKKHNNHRDRRRYLLDGANPGPLPAIDERRHRRRRRLKANPHQLSNAERIPFREVYEFMLEKFQYDIELYQWAKRRSLVQCLDRGDPW